MTDDKQLHDEVVNAASERDTRIESIREKLSDLELNLSIAPLSIIARPKRDSTAVAVLSLKGLGELEGMLTELADRRRHTEEAAGA